ncbi:hypothetical protein [Streptantibioticus silvisoli]|uniref:Cytochrome C oxidase subunit I n=1 Tax=Streptantibioticus silvisoli TaxID=2705255 RepID=A0ABT6WAY2_9ACTN|nr:hypothetical protein [Streptantibioticus silvisoli]MDI5967646.1 hypothetical protein [Streptantibioticus silvisoli]
MSPAGAPQGRGAGTAAGINALEGYLLWQAETSRAAERARRFTDTLPWLTTAQREEVERAYADDHLGHAEAALRAFAERCEQLRSEYRAVYRRLRRRLVAGYALVAGVLAAVGALVTTVR